MIQVTTKGATTKDFKTLDAIIDLETKRKVERVSGAEDFGIMTACYIDGDFVLVSEYDVDSEMYNRLKNA